MAPCAGADWRHGASCAATRGMKAATIRCPIATAGRGCDGPAASVHGDRDLGRHSARLPVADRAASAAAAQAAAAGCQQSDHGRRRRRTRRPTASAGSDERRRCRRRCRGCRSPRLVCRGSISLLGARLDDLVLTDYRETLAPEFAGRAAAGAAVREAALLHSIRLERRARRTGEAAGQRHGLGQLGRDAVRSAIRSRCRGTTAPV